MKTNKTFNRQRLGAFHFISNVATNEFLYLYTTSIIVLVSYWSPSYLSNNVLLRRQCQSIPLTLGRLQEIQSSSYSSCCGFSIHCLSRFSVSVFVQSVSASRRERECALPNMWGVVRSSRHQYRCSSSIQRETSMDRMDRSEIIESESINSPHPSLTVVSPLYFKPHRVNNPDSTF